MKKCKNCGTELEDNAIACTQCENTVFDNLSTTNNNIIKKEFSDGIISALMSFISILFIFISFVINIVSTYEFKIHPTYVTQIAPSTQLFNFVGLLTALLGIVFGVKGISKDKKTFAFIGFVVSLFAIIFFALVTIIMYFIFIKKYLRF